MKRFAKNFQNGKKLLVGRKLLIVFIKLKRYILYTILQLEIFGIGNKKIFIN